MAGIENNATFWQKLDTILLSSNITIDRPKGTCHFKYKNLIWLKNQVIEGDNPVFDFYEFNIKIYIFRVELLGIAALSGW